MSEAPSSLARPAPPSTLEEDAVLVDGLVELIRQRDEHLADHLNAVGLLGGRLAAALKYGPDVVARVTLAGRLHDLGLGSIKPFADLRALTDAEWRKIRLHPDFGASAVAAFPQLAKYRSIVRAHHERIDGAGYPDGLIGSEIPYQARIIAIADAFHSMTVASDYRPMRPPWEAIVELNACAGTQFDEEFVAAFTEMMGGKQRLERHA